MKQLLLFTTLFFSITTLAQNYQFDWVVPIGAPYTDGVTAVTHDTQDNIYVTGKFTGTFDFDPGPGVYNLNHSGTGCAYILKLNSLGQFVWAKKLNTNFSNGASQIAIGSNGDVYVSGGFIGTTDFDPGDAVYNLTTENAFSGNGYILKLNSNGDFVWVKKREGHHYVGSMILDTADNICMTGGFNASMDFDPGAGTHTITSAGYYDMFVLKLSPDGEFLWAKTIGAGLVYDETGKDIQSDTNNNLYITGDYAKTVDFDPGENVHNMTSSDVTSFGGQYPDPYLLKLDSDGNYVWSKSFGGTDYDRSMALAIDAAGEITVMGEMSGTVNFNPDGNAFELTSTGGRDSYICKFDNSGDFIWARQFGSEAEVYPKSIAVDAQGDLYATGHFNGTVNFDPATTTSVLTSLGEYDIYILNIAGNGDFKWVKSFGSSLDETPTRITINSLGDVITTGDYYTTIDFDTGEGIHDVNCAGNADGFIHKLKNVSLGVATVFDASVKVYPNPSNNFINIEVADGFWNVNVSVFDLLGHKIKAFAMQGHAVVDGLTPGLYLLELEADGRRKVVKIVVN